MLNVSARRRFFIPGPLSPPSASLTSDWRPHPWVQPLRDPAEKKLLPV